MYLQLASGGDDAGKRNQPRAAERDAAHSSGVEVENSARIVATGNYA